MKIIVPMAGRGSRLRPHTLTVPKPLVPVAGKPIVHRLVEDIAALSDEKIDEIAFVIGDFGDAVEKELVEVAESLGAKGSIYHQEEALGTAHAIYCAEPSLRGKTIVAFADTLFRADFRLDTNSDGTIWVNKVDDPSAFGVVKLSNDGAITDFIEKPKDFVSDLAIIGIYYFKEGETLRDEIKYLLDNDIRDRGEFQITDALENMKNKGLRFEPGEVIEWLDCGNRHATVHSNLRVLEFDPSSKGARNNVTITDSVVVEPCYIGNNVTISNSVVGPHVSIGEGTKIDASIVRNTIIQKDADIRNLNAEASMIGSHAKVNGTLADLSVGDYNEITL